MAVLRQFGWLLLLVSYAAAQSAPATLRDVKVVPIGKGIQVDVSLSDSVQPSISTTTKPDRLILDFPNTTASAHQQHISVNANGIRAVRFGLNSSGPPVTRVVIDLDSVHLYEVHRNGTTISLTMNRSKTSEAARQVPPAATSGSLFEIFHRRAQSSPRVADPNEALKRPIPGGVSKPNTTVSTNSTPTAAHPNRGSLQDGVVFPQMGTPGTGNVPTTVADRTRPTSAISTNPTTTPTTVTPVAKTIVQPEPPKGDSAIATSSVVPVNSAPAAAPSVTVVAPAKEMKTPEPIQSSASAPVESANTVAKDQPSVVTPKPLPTTTAAIAHPVTDTVQPLPSTPQSSPSAPAMVVESKPEPSTPKTNESLPEIATATPPTVLPSTTQSSSNESPAPTADTADQSQAMLSAIDPNLKTVFRVKYVADGVAYLDGGRSSGLAEGMKLEIKDSDLPIKQGAIGDPADPRVVAELEVAGLADTSAVTDIHTPKRPVKVGDLAYLSNGDAQSLIQQRTLSPTRQYPIVVAFSEGDPLDEEVRKEVPRPPMPSVNRARGRIGFDYMGTVSHDNPSSMNSDIGMVMRADITRIGGTYWNLSGYWRGRLHARSAASQPTLQDLINRTYHLGMFYDNPDSRLVAGVGRFYLPWAPSLDTIDGGYFGVKLSTGATAGFFAGSTPDPTSWSYNPDRRMAGAFINFQGGDYDAVHYTSTSGLGISALKWQMDRPFVFFENTLSYKRYLSIYDSLQADSPRGNAAVAAPGPGLSRNFLTVRLQVHPRVELDFNHNYLRDIPTYDPSLVGTGLLDQYLFQGASAGARVEVSKQVFVYTSLGSSNRSGDARHSLNQLYGLTFARLPWWGLRADAHYSRFSSSFADGSYRSISLGRNVTDDLRFDVLVGDQNYTSTLAASDRTRFVNTNAEFSIGPRYFMQGGFTVNRGQAQNYDQWLFTVGYRFDSKARHQ